MKKLAGNGKGTDKLFAGERGRMLLIFGIEGMLFQFVMSLSGVTGFGTNLYATNLGATDSQIGMIQLVANLFAVCLLIPMGVVADRARNAKTVPIVLMLFMGFAYMFYGTVPVMGSARMVFFFIGLALTAGVLMIYNGIWQAFFGDVTPLADRNRVFAFRNRFVFIIATIAPILCGTLLTRMPDVEGKLMVLRVFFYVCGVLCFLNGLVLTRVRGGARSAEQLNALPKVGLREMSDVIRGLAHDKRFVFYFSCIMFFYFSWHIDWSMWYIGQTQYVGLTESQLSIFVALSSILQLLFLGVFVRMNEKKGVNFTFLFVILSLVFCPTTMLVTSLFPAGAQPMVFMVMGAIACIPQGAANLCLVQMLLDVAPVRNRSLVVSISMAFVQLSNGLMPFLGVQLYNALGADFSAFILFNTVVLVMRSASMVIFVVRWLRSGKQTLAA